MAAIGKKPGQRMKGGSTLFYPGLPFGLEVLLQAGM